MPSRCAALALPYLEVPEINSQDAALYHTLGRIEQSIEDIRSLILNTQHANDELDRRVTSLERSRTWQKAWVAGATAACVGVFSFAMYVYQFVKDARH